MSSAMEAVFQELAAEPMSPEQDKLRLSLNQRMADARRQRQELSDGLADSEAEQIPDLAKLRKLRDRKAELMVAEMHLRSAIDRYYKALPPHRQAALEAAEKALAAAQENVRRKLLGIGYPDDEITAGMIGAHPSTQDLVGPLNEAQSRQRENDLQQYNTAALEQLQTEFQELRRRMLATV